MDREIGRGLADEHVEQQIDHQGQQEIVCASPGYGLREHHDKCEIGADQQRLQAADAGPEQHRYVHAQEGREEKRNRALGALPAVRAGEAVPAVDHANQSRGRVGDGQDHHRHHIHHLVRTGQHEQ